ncbi:hypothetical protein [Oceaniglobus indicus]|uniref:hypothetical protein n=1 Tax=Oceaniglobus indicus TaxID=2047749 RepID=UPI0011AB6BCB|nr:hypothetical protein [Oceaniglobus indicus]
MRTRTWIAGVAGLALAWPGAVAAQGPLSAIDWLSDSVILPAPVAMPRRVAPPRADDIVDSALPETVTVTPLGAPSPDTVGLLPARRLGLPPDLWGASPSAVIAQKIATARTPDLPAMRDLLKNILIAELDPPIDSGDDRTLFLARIDRLLSLGALGPAARMLDRAGRTEPAYFRRWFDIALLTGTEDVACARMRALPQISPTYAARIFCLARTGDWQAAALTLDTAKALGLVDTAEDHLIARFLSAELSEEPATLPPIRLPTPLQFSMYSAIGEPIATANLPLAFAHADLRETTGWRARIAAAERLARDGALAANELFEVYGERMPAASGGVWDRVAAVQRFQAALNDGAAATVSEALPAAWAAATDVGLEVPFAEAFGDALAPLALSGAADRLRLKIGLLSPRAEAIARAHGPTNGEEAFQVALATGDLAQAEAYDAVSTALRDGLLGEPTGGDDLSARKGEAMLRAIELFGIGAAGNLDELQQAVSLLNALGQGDVARRAGLQLLLLDFAP